MNRLVNAGDTADRQSAAEGRSSFTWRWVADTALSHRRELVLANLAAVFAVIASVPIPLLMPLLVDEVLLDQPGILVAVMNAVFPSAWWGPALYLGTVLVITLLLRLVALALNVWQTREFTQVAKDVTYRIRHRLLGHMQRVSMAEYETLGSGTVASHLVTDVNAVDEFIGQSVSKVVVSILMLIGVGTVLFWMSWQLALFILLGNPLVVWVTVQLGKKVKHLKREENTAFELFQQTLQETLDAIHQIRAANRERHYLRVVVDRARGIQTHSAAFSWKSDAANRFSFTVFLLGFDIFRTVSMLMVVLSDLTVGRMMAVFGYLWFMMTPVQELLNIQYAFFAARAALGRINNLLALRREPDYPHISNPFAGKSTVSVSTRDLVFAYGDGEPVLNGVTMEVARGERVALVGASGGGKSTLVQVLLGMYPARAGTVLYDGVPVTEIGLDVVRENVATVLQHPAMFNDTVRMNLTLGRDAVDRELWRALEVAQLADTVAAMDKGLDTLIGRHGVRLSGGQLQRLAIARMLLCDPKVVILDEATSAVDTATEAALHRALAERLAGLTMIIIAHRLSAVRQADRVYVFESGRIIEEGAHEVLIERGGLYQKLYGGIRH